MNSLTLFVLLASIAMAAGYYRNWDSSSVESNNRLLRELQLEIEEEMDKPMSRPRRVPAPGETRACGRKLIAFVFQVCGDSCTPHQGKDIATLCCGSQCSEETIKEACCPSKIV